MDIKLSYHDKKWLKDKYPKLEINPKENTAKGEIYFDRVYNKVRITDFYTVQIDFKTKINSILPQVKEINGKIEKIAKELAIPPIDLHINESDKTLCLCIDEREKDYLPNSFDINIFFENILEPILYWVSYYGKYKKPPWEEYAHRELGHLELYAEEYINIKKLKEKFSIEKLNELKKLKGHDKCVCGSGEKLRDCHKLIYNAIYKLKKELYG